MGVMKLWSLPLFLVACGGESPPPRPPVPVPPPAPTTVAGAVDAAFAQAAHHHALASLLRAPVADTGMWFDDAACAAQFAAPATIDAATLPAFAACLEALPFERTGDATHSVLAYRGIQTKLVYVTEGEHAWVSGVGHASRAEAPEAAVVAPALLTQVVGDKHVMPDEETMAALGTRLPTQLVGVFVACMDPAGAVQQVTILKSTRSAAYDAKIQREVHGWRYAPFRIGGTPLPVCTALTFTFRRV